jgi:two-component system, NtrC family, nitrogen regulation response regulator GlnG
LENAVLRASLLAPSNTVQADDVELGRGGVRLASSNLDAGASLTDLIARRIAEMVESNDKEPRDLYQKLVGELEKPLIEIALERAGGNQVHAARILGLNRNTLRKKLTEHRIVPQKTLPP